MYLLGDLFISLALKGEWKSQNNKTTMHWALYATLCHAAFLACSSRQSDGNITPTLYLVRCNGSCLNEGIVV